MESFSWKKIAMRALTLIPIFIVVLLVFSFFGGPPLYVLFGLAGPTAGVTRALRALLMLDFEASFAYHPLAIPLFLVFIFSLFHDLLPVSKKTANFIFITAGVSTFIFFIFRFL